MVRRLLRHLFTAPAGLRRIFDAQAMQRIESAIAESESRHGGEIRFAIEASLNPLEVIRGVQPRDRALDAFAQLGVWDTEQNNGVLIYVLWADHDVEIVADRGFNARVSSEQWAEVCGRMEQLFAAGRATDAVLEGVRSAGELIGRHFPATDRNELSNRPAVL